MCLCAQSMVNFLELPCENGSGEAEILSSAYVNALDASAICIVRIRHLGSGAKRVEHLGIIVLVRRVHPRVVGTDAVEEVT